jgi:hypothetical protein
LIFPARFEWARSLLGSKAWEPIIKDKETEGSVTFSIPAKCPINKAISCPQESSEVPNEAIGSSVPISMQNVSPSTPECV